MGAASDVAGSDLIVMMISVLTSHHLLLSGCFAVISEYEHHAFFVMVVIYNYSTV